MVRGTGRWSGRPGTAAHSCQADTLCSADPLTYQLHPNIRRLPQLTQPTHQPSPAAHPKPSLRTSKARVSGRGSPGWVVARRLGKRLPPGCHARVHRRGVGSHRVVHGSGGDAWVHRRAPARSQARSAGRGVAVARARCCLGAPAVLHCQVRPADGADGAGGVGRRSGGEWLGAHQARPTGFQAVSTAPLYLRTPTTPLPDCRRTCPPSPSSFVLPAPGAREWLWQR